MARITRSFSIHVSLPITLLLSACVGSGDDPAAPSDPETATATSALTCTTYTVTDLGIPTGGGSSSASALDDAGHVAGTFRPTTAASPLHAFTWTAAGGLVDLGTLGGSNSFGYGVSGARTVGESNVANGDSHAYLRDGAGMHDLGTLGGGGIDASRARGVNASGVAVGESRLANGFQHAARYASGSATDLGTLVGTPTSNSIAFAINASGVVVGASDTTTGASHAARWAGGTITDLGSVGTASSVANAVNANGDAAGNLVTSFVPRPAKFAGGAVIELGVLAGFESATGNGINNAGLVVGTAQHSNGEAPSTIHGFLHDGTSAIDLNAVVTGQGWLITAANAINTAGQIAGAGVSTAGGMGADTRTHALLLTPACGAAPAFRSIATTTNGTTVARPAGVVAGDFLLAALEYDADPLVITPPTGWTLVADQRAGAGTADVFHGLVYAHAAGASEPASYTFASPAGVYVDVQVAAYSHATAVDVVAKTSATAASISAPSVTTTGANRILVAIFLDFAGGTWSTASGMTRRSSFDSNSLQDQLRPTAGATGVRTASNATGAMAAFSVALQ